MLIFNIFLDKGITYGPLFITLFRLKDIYTLYWRSSYVLPSISIWGSYTTEDKARWLFCGTKEA